MKFSAAEMIAKYFSTFIVIKKHYPDSKTSLPLQFYFIYGVDARNYVIFPFFFLIFRQNSG